MPSVLFVFTSADKNLSGGQTVRIPGTYYDNIDIYNILHAGMVFA